MSLKTECTKHYKFVTSTLNPGIICTESATVLAHTTVPWYYNLWYQLIKYASCMRCTLFYIMIEVWFMLTEYYPWNYEYSLVQIKMLMFNGCPLLSLKLYLCSF